MTEMRCHFCGKPAEAIKVEIDRECDDEGREVETEVRLGVCLADADYWYDGTEDRPGVLPLQA